jgi:hypothetical protein
MSEPLARTTCRPLTCSAAGSPVNRPAEQQPLLGDVWAWTEPIAGSGGSSFGSLVSFSREQSSWKTPTRRGSTRCREIWRELATTYPDMTSRLRELVRRIYAGECSLLPTVTARDWRSEGRSDHPRLMAARGLPLNETLGCRVSPELCEWMMGFPVGYTAVSESPPSETPLFHSAPNGSAGD